MIEPFVCEHEFVLTVFWHPFHGILTQLDGEAPPCFLHDDGEIGSSVTLRYVAPTECSYVAYSQAREAGEEESVLYLWMFAWGVNALLQFLKREEHFFLGLRLDDLGVVGGDEPKRVVVNNAFPDCEVECRLEAPIILGCSTFLDGSRLARAFNLIEELDESENVMFVDVTEFGVLTAILHYVRLRLLHFVHS